jgi:hypothetical protein
MCPRGNRIEFLYKRVINFILQGVTTPNIKQISQKYETEWLTEWGTGK